ncbi:cytochrome C oxidase subunit IV family protein [Candidatus Poriferisocius sp.]|uniref:cytochrome C oxidase subunit IV family protein n=1 Tax=Candidatus Poriferisocius sp. TaxID=3101276 RepID=UPI003B5A31AE
MATVTPTPDTADRGTEVDQHASGSADADHGTAGHSHPTDWLYVKVAIALALLTAFEVFTYFESVHGWGDTAIILMLVAMMVLKFFLVVAFFMHLKFDSPIFWRLFVFGLILAMAVYMVMLTAFRFW